MKRIRRQWGFLRTLLDEANHQTRKDILQHANKDQINAVSEIIMNTLRGNHPVPPSVVVRLRKYKKPLRDLIQRKHSVLKRRKVLQAQKGSGFWKALQLTCHYLT